jgi:hypothetical protein
VPAIYTDDLGELKYFIGHIYIIVLLSRSALAGKKMAKPIIPLIALPGRVADVHVVKTPPILELGSENDYACGACGTVLLRANAGQVHNVVLECSRCGALNKADI